MIKKNDLERIHKEIDGLNSPEDSANLKEFFFRNSEAQELYNDLNTLSEMLNEVPALDPPANLKKQILNTLPKTKYATQEEQSLSRAPHSKIRLKLGYAFAFGILVGVILSSLVFNKIKSVDTSKLSGTLLLNNLPEDFHTGQSHEIKLNGINGEVNLKYTEDIILAELNLTSQQAVEVAMTFNPSELVLNGFTCSREEGLQFTTNHGDIKLNHAGSQSYNFLFKKKSQTESSITIKIISNGNVLFEKQLSPTF